MRDFPIFTTDYGVSTLILREIPYREEAYIRVQDVQPGFEEEHLRECVSFCRMAGAEKIYGTGKGMEGYPAFMDVVQMRGTIRPDPEMQECLFPVTEATVSQWRKLYNEAMRTVDNARTLESRDEKLLTEKAGAYFIHKNGELLGIGWLEDHKILAVASAVKGAGMRIVHTLLSSVDGEDVELEVASTNGRAIALYEKLGLVKTKVLEHWQDLTGCGRGLRIDDSSEL